MTTSGQADLPEPRRRPLLRAVGGQLRGWRATWAWWRGVTRSFVTSFLALTASLWLLPGPQSLGSLDVASLAVLVLAIGALVRPLLTRLTVLFGILGLLLTGFLAQAAVLAAALSLSPAADPFPFVDVVLTSWVAAAVAAGVNWIFDASSDEAFYGQLLGRAVRRTRRSGTEGPGLLVVQLDGVSEPLLRQAIAAGAVPTVSRWVRSGDYRMRSWHTGVPATTPAGQAVLLHGDTDTVPAYRWYDKDQERLVVVSRPADAAAVQEAISDGRGLLADGGTSVSNLFSGDAPTRLLTISDARAPGGDRGAASYAALRWGFLRSIALFLGQLVMEWHQARRQRVRNVVPRVRRGGAFLLLRGLTTVVLRDLNLAVVTEQLTRGTPVVFVDFVDYDEVAHHAGPTRPETMRTLENLDRVLRFFEQVTSLVGRRYELAVVSDHGQAQGWTFEQLTGQTLDDVVAHLARESTRASVGAASASVPSHSDEAWATVHMLLSDAPGSGRAVTRVATRAATRAGGDTARPTGDDHATARLVVAASGSLAHVYRADVPGRVTREQWDLLHPGMVDSLAAHPQVGAVMTRLADGRVRVDGVDGSITVGREGGDLVTEVDGVDPLAVYGPRAAADLAALDRKRHVGDLVLFGAYDPELAEVVAFEELVGSHGGLGGWQTEALLLHPADWAVSSAPLDGADVHRVLVHRLAQLGLRETP